MNTAESMCKNLCLVAFVVWFFPLVATAELTNRVEITPVLHFMLTQSPETAQDDSALPNTNRFDSHTQIYAFVSTPKSHGVVFALLPKEQTFVFQLRDTNGNTVAKTQLGTKYSKPVDEAVMVRELKRTYPGWTDKQITGRLAHALKIKHYPTVVTHGYLRELFVPEDYFVITNKGMYKLDVQMRVWTQKTNGEYGVVLSPPVSVEVEK